MTAEIVIMNRQAVALAADSAVTFRDHQGEKIFPSANKIFTLSKFHPVGVMIYGGAEFMGVPWETVIKVFRSKLGDTAFDTLGEYASALFQFLCEDRRFSPQMRQFAYADYVITSFLSEIQKEVREELHRAVEEQGEITKEQGKKIFLEGIRRRHAEWKAVPYLNGDGETRGKQFRAEFKDLIARRKKELFPRHLTSVSSRWLTDLVLWCLAKNPTHDSAPHSTGLVIAGFGEQEIFPGYLSFAVGGVIGDRVQVRELKRTAISRDERAIVAPFAQKEMVRTFMEGIDPDYRTAVFGSFAEIVMALPGLIVEDMEGVSDADKNAFVQKHRANAKRLLAKYRSALDQYRHEEHVMPIVRAIGILPKKELAPLAESLVNITAFKRRVSMDAETVGGPIDVAVISKGDGFVWINRKHYFETSLNQHFLQNYLRSPETPSAEEEEEG